MSLHVAPPFAAPLGWTSTESAGSMDAGPLHIDPLTPRHAVASDPQMERLSRALDAAERSQSEFAGIYADAVRLAIQTRLLTGKGEDADTQVAEMPASAPQSERPKASLPKWRLKRVASYVEENLAKSVTLAGMAAAAGLSRMHFAAQFRVATGLRPHEYLLRRRIERAQELLVGTRASLVEVAMDVGFQTQAHFTTVFRRFVGDTPHQWRRSANLRGDFARA